MSKSGISSFKAILPFLAVVLFCTAAVAQLLLGAGDGIKPSGGGGCVASQWDAAHKGADITLSGSPCKLTFAGGDATNFETVRSTSSHTGTSTSYYFEHTITGAVSASYAIGISDSSETTGPSPSTYCGATADSVGYNPFTGDVLRGGIVVLTIATATAGDVIGVAVDMASVSSGSPAVYFRKNGGSFSGAVGLPTGGTLFVCGSTVNNAGGATVNFTATPIAGYSAWG